MGRLSDTRPKHYGSFLGPPHNHIHTAVYYHLSLAPGATGGGGASVETEKEQLIKQVLSLTEEQVALLPPEQKASIVMLRQQLKKQGL